MKTQLLVLTALLVSACASKDQDKIAGAATTPLSDLNLVSAPIPEALAQAQKAPYSLPSEPVCSSTKSEIRSLDEVLGPDLDAPPTDSNPGLIERGGGVVASAFQKTAEGVVPFRSWVRKLSGAERYSKQVAAAISAGVVRRAYLKGVAQARNC